MSVLAGFTGRDVIAQCDRLEGNFSLLTDGNRVRALVLAIQTIEQVLGTHRVELFFGSGELPGFTEAVLILLRVRLELACVETGMVGRAIPAALVADAVA